MAVHLSRATGSESVVVEALSYPTICRSLPNVQVVNLKQYPALAGLTLADSPNDTSQCIDVLIGTDHYWELVGDELIRTDGLVPINSKLGWLISGPLKGNF